MKNKPPKKDVPIMSPHWSLKKLSSLLTMMKEYDIAEFEWKTSSGKIKLKSKSEALLQPMLSQSPLNYMNPLNFLQPPQVPLSPPSAEAVKPSHLKTIVSPMVGTFYSSPSPDQSPYVSEGRPIKKGDPLCIIEAMKLMNEIESEVEGKIVKILVENGQAVDFGQPLFSIEPL